MNIQATQHSVSDKIELVLWTLSIVIIAAAPLYGIASLTTYV